MKKTNDTSLGNRMKSYENNSRHMLEVNSDNVIAVRIDGKAFHTYTKSLDKPFDVQLHQTFARTMHDTAEQLQNCVFGYSQSDEASFILDVGTEKKSQYWFNGNIQKICSVSCSIFSAFFNEHRIRHKMGLAFFDARVWVLPRAEAINYLIWRQQDAIRNSRMGMAQQHFSQKQLNKKSAKEAVEMLQKKGIYWSSLAPHFQRGFVTYKVESISHTAEGEEFTRSSWVNNMIIPHFVQDRDFVEKHLKYPVLEEA